jgi:hypothetical protein
MANGTEPPKQPGFFGAAPVALRIDADNQLRNGSDAFPAPSAFATSSSPLLQLSPVWWYAPDFFIGMSKPSAFCKLALSQFKALAPMTNQLSWSITYSLIPSANENIPSQDFTLTPQDAATFQNMPLPGGRGNLTCRVYAYVGGDPGKTFEIISNTLKALEGVVGTSSTQTFLAIPAADILALNQAETLFQNILTAFAPPKYTQQWMDLTPIPVAVTQGAASANPRALKLASGYNAVVLIPAQSNPTDHVPGQPDKVVPYVQNLAPYIGKSQYQFTLGPTGVTMSGGTNPFEAIPYVALTVEVDESSS